MRDHIVIDGIISLRWTFNLVYNYHALPEILSLWPSTCLRSFILALEIV